MPNTVRLFGVDIPENATRLDSRDLQEHARDQPLPPEIGDFAQLTFLWLNNRNLTGTLPVELAKLTALTSLDLVNNNFHGKLPVEVGKLTQLTRIRIVGNKLSGSLPTQLSRLTKLRVLDTQHNRFSWVCDCRLLRWYPDFIARNNVRATSDPCDMVNRNGGSYPHLVHSAEMAPCSHVAVLKRSVRATSDQIYVGWRYSMFAEELVSYEDTDDWSRPVIRDSFASIDLGMMAAKFAKCSVFMSPNSTTSSTLNGSTNAGRGLGFRLRLSNTTYSQEVCMFAGEQANATSETFFSASVTNLKPAGDYDLSIEPFFLYFSFYVEDRETRNRSWIANPVSYVYGPASTTLRVSTSPGVPAAGPQNLRVTSSTDREFSVDWDSPNKFYSNGDIQRYEVQIKDITLGVTYLKEVVTRTIAWRYRLEPNSLYTVKVRGRTVHPTYGPFSEALNVSTCPVHMQRSLGSVDACEAQIGYFSIAENEDRSAHSCDELPVGSLKPDSCLVEGIRVQDLQLNRGYWRSGLESLRILPCPRSEFCSPLATSNISVADADVYCSPLHRGVYCFDCLTDFTMGPEGCFKCTTEKKSQSALSLVAIAAVFFVLLFALLTNIFRKVGFFTSNAEPAQQQDGAFTVRRLTRRISYVHSASMERFRSFISSDESTRGALRRLFRRLQRVNLNTKIRIMCGFFQVLFSFQRTFEPRTIGNRGTFEAALDFVSSLNIAVLIQRMNVSCIWSLTHYNDLFVATLLPITLVLLLKVLCLCMTRLYKRMAKQINYELISAILFVAFLVYPAVSQIVLETFLCEDFPNSQGNTYKSALRSDYSLSCEPSIERTIWIVYAGMMVAVYPVGILLAYGLLMVRFRRILRCSECGRRDKEELKMVAFLIKPYSRDYYWFETYELLRKLSQTALLGLFQQSTALPATLPLVAQNLCLLSVIILAFTSPYKGQSDFWFALGSLTLLLPAAQLYVLDPTGQTSVDKPTGISVIILAEFGLFLATIGCDCTFAADDKLGTGDVEPLEGPNGCNEDKLPRENENGFTEQPSRSGPEESVLIRHMSDQSPRWSQIVTKKNHEIVEPGDTEKINHLKTTYRDWEQKSLVDLPGVCPGGGGKGSMIRKESENVTLLSEDFYEDSLSSEPDPEALTDNTTPIYLDDYPVSAVAMQRTSMEDKYVIQ